MNAKRGKMYAKPYLVPSWPLHDGLIKASIQYGWTINYDYIDAAHTELCTADYAKMTYKKVVV